MYSKVNWDAEPFISGDFFHFLFAQHTHDFDWIEPDNILKVSSTFSAF